MPAPAVGVGGARRRVGDGARLGAPGSAGARCRRPGVVHGMMAAALRGTVGRQIERAAAPRFPARQVL